MSFDMPKKLNAIKISNKNKNLDAKQDGLNLDIGQRDFNNLATAEKLEKHQSGYVSTDVIMASKAAAVTGGRDITVYSCDTDIEYDYDKLSQHCILGLSVAENIEFRQLSDEDEVNMLKDAKEIIQNIINKKYLDFLDKNRVYESAECCVCMDDKPDTIIYVCGHKCIHYDCLARELKACPMCRKTITAYLQVDNSDQTNTINKIIKTDDTNINDHSTDVVLLETF